MGPMCQVCALDIAVRKQRASKVTREQQVKEWVEDVNVQKYITNYRGEVSVGGALERDAELEEKEQDENIDTDEEEEEEEEEEDIDEYEEDRYYEADEEDYPGPSDLIPESCAAEWNVHPDSPPFVERTRTSMTVSSRLSIRSYLSVFLEHWTSDIFERTLEGQIEDTVFVGGARDDQDLCPLCRDPVGDPTFQHLLKCQYAYDELARMEALWRL